MKIETQKVKFGELPLGEAFELFGSSVLYIKICTSGGIHRAVNLISGVTRSDIQDQQMVKRQPEAKIVR